MKQKIKDNWIFLLFIIPFAFVCIMNKKPENDIWFILNNGRYLFAHGIPHIDHFSIHEGFTYVMQQWITSGLFWTLFSKLGKHGIILMIYMMSILLMFAYYRLLYTVSKDKTKSVIFTAITFTLMCDFIVTRPQIFTYLILIIELISLEKYVEHKTLKYLMPLPILSMLLANMHASMWMFQFIFLLPFLFNTIKIKNVTRDKIELKPLLLTIGAMVLFGLINPYGLDALIYIFKSYGNPILSEVIKEMSPLTFGDWHTKVVLGSIFIMLCLLTFKKELKLDIRHFLFICGVTILAFMHLKGYPYFIIIFFYSLSYLTKDIKIKNIFENNKYFLALSNGIRIGLTIMLPVTLVFTLYLSFNNYNFKNTAIGDIGDYLVDNYARDLKDIVLYIDYNNGGYTEYLGISSYIDPRAELFFKKFNGKEDIFLEYYASYKNKNFDFEFFISKYGFTHLIVDANSYFDDYLKDREDYELVFTQESGLRNLYVLKDFAQEANIDKTLEITT